MTEEEILAYAPEEATNVRIEDGHLVYQMPDEYFETRRTFNQLQFKRGNLSKRKPRLNKALFNKFLEIYTETFNFTAAAKAIHYDRSNLWKLINGTESLKKQFEDAKSAKIDQAEQELFRRANGYEEDIIFKRTKTGTTTKYSDNLLLALMKAHRPEKYSNNTSIELTGADKGPIEISESRAKLINLLGITEKDLSEAEDVDYSE